MLVWIYSAAADADTLLSYKFYCFNGEPKFLHVEKGIGDHEINYLTFDWNFTPFKRNDYEPLKKFPLKPAHFEEMLDIARKLSYGYLFLRVDLYEINGHIYFGELTLFPGAGFTPYSPAEWDRNLGEFLSI